jgi:peptidoglycan hydrolase-like protein with peptidoglycan-binding domain
MSTAQLQAALIALGYLAAPASGVFDDQTMVALAGFQATHGLPSDGAATPATIAAIRTALGGH